MEHTKSSTLVGGVDVGKHRLAAAIEGIGSQLAIDNDAKGIARLVDWFVEHGVDRVGIEATGGYERKLRATLEAQGLAVVVHQPLEVKLYGRLTRQHAKTDAGDARLIAAATRMIERPAKRADPALVELSQRLTAYEHVADQLMAMRTFKESIGLLDLRALIEQQICAVACPQSDAGPAVDGGHQGHCHAQGPLRAAQEPARHRPDRGRQPARAHAGAGQHEPRPGGIADRRGPACP